MEEFLNPAAILKQLGLRKDAIAADFGSGSGGWALPLAKKLEDGKVYAIDILAEPLSALQSKAILEKISNIETIKSDIESEQGSTLSGSSVDLVLITNLLFQAQKREKIFEETKRILKDNGEVLVVDWKKEAPFGPLEGRIPEGEVKKIAEKFGFKLKKEFAAGKYHYGLVFEKP